ncbi:hypothetical protein [Solemya velesiana gill symbiont]|nr:hypothetical protein [Solemya velesiana gill symbiont]
MILLSITHGLYSEVPRSLAGIAAWIAGALLFVQVKGLGRTQALVLLGVGLAAMTWGVANGAAVPLEKALSTNQALLAMLAAVSFLRLVILPEATTEEQLPTGPKALWRTLLGVHFFGAVINLSAVMILGDRQSRREALSPTQAIVLSRGFAVASHWSSFFAAMGVALTNAPGAQFTTLSPVGLPIALIALVVTGLTLSRREQGVHFRGYPMQFSALWIPALLSMGVMGCHLVWRELPILTLISILSITLTIVLLLMRNRSEGMERLGQHIANGLPRMRGELTLFLSAGILAAGITAAMDAMALDLAIDHFGAQEATLLLLFMVGISILGVHPVISIATAGSILMPLVADPNLLALTFLMTWALGITTSPFSGMHLAMQGRFGINAYRFPRWNGGFAIFMLLVDSVALHLYANW